MRFEVKPNCLVFTVDESEQRDLKALSEMEGFDADDFMIDMLEDMVTNDEFYWLDARYTGDMTDGPMLAILGEMVEHESEDCDGFYPCGSGVAQPVLWRWVFMDYAVESIQGALAKHGKAVLQGGAFMTDEALSKDGEASLKVPFGFEIEA